jgi:oligopeptide/dipeptide ABC transporter ATP-binding protein
MPEETLLDVQSLSTSFTTKRGTVRAVDGVSLSVERGESVGIVGESGSGKSVLVKTIMNLLPGNAEIAPETVIRYKGHAIDTMTPGQKMHLWGPEISMIFQDPMTSLNPVRKVGALISDPIRYHLGRSKSDARTVASELLAKVGLSDPERRLNQYPHELSGGMRQRVSIAIALSCEPQILIADEPTTALDVTVQRQILELLRRLQRERHMGMILISHDLGVVAGYTDSVSVMYAGKLIESAPTRDLFQHVRHRYTSALMQSTPSPTARPHSRLFSIAGSPPDLISETVGCRFAPRCVHSREVCAQEEPRFVATEPDHYVACHHPVTSGATGGQL